MRNNMHILDLLQLLLHPLEMVLLKHLAHIHKKNEHLLILLLHQLGMGALEQFLHTNMRIVHLRQLQLLLLGMVRVKRLVHINTHALHLLQYIFRASSVPLYYFCISSRKCGISFIHCRIMVKRFWFGVEVI